MASLPPDAPRPRLCRIKKDFEGQDYGFNLHADRNKSQFIGAVDAGSPAELASLRTGDRIVAVNGVSVAAEPHKQVVARIKENPLQCALLVIDEKGETWYRDRKLPIPVYQDFGGTPEKKTVGNGRVNEASPAERKAVVGAEKSTPPTYREATSASSAEKNILRPRLCRLVKPYAEAEFGFNLHAEKNNGHYIGNVDKDSVAEKAGLQEGQRIVGANGILVYPSTPNREVVQIIKSDPSKTELLVASPEVDQWYRKNEREYSFQDAEIFEPVIVQMAQMTLSKASPGVVENGLASNGVQNGHELEASDREIHIIQHKEAVAKPAEPARAPEEPKKEQKETKVASKEKGAAVERSTSEHARSSADHGATLQAHLHHQDWMNLSAAELRERVSRQKKADPRKQQLSLLQKYEIVHNL